ncbi:hypothetical protein ACH5RR_030166 [Cinchona calisaya]|uniref:Uncharacterized protein n=1 Tax=Cinchona calisaya TaxID=153742 RepID=A0ABD2YXB7_9GENT
MAASLVVSPRISFSNDLKETDVIPCEGHQSRSDALLLESIDFNFCISQSISQQGLLSSADELFANGKIIPAEFKKITTINSSRNEITSKEIYRSKPISACYRKDTAFKISAAATRSVNGNAEAALDLDTEKKSLKELLSVNTESDAETEEQKKPSSKTFWQFKRSSSLNLDSSRSNTLIRSLHFLSRSNSTGSTPNPTPSGLPKVLKKQHSQNDQPLSNKRTDSSVPSSSVHYFQSYRSYKSPARKNYEYGVRVSPVLNISHCCISKGTARLFGFGSLLCNGKSRKKKKCNL